MGSDLGRSGPAPQPSRRRGQGSPLPSQPPNPAGSCRVPCPSLPGSETVPGWLPPVKAARRWLVELHQAPRPAPSCGWELAPAAVLAPRPFCFTREVQSSLMNQRTCSMILLKKKYCKCKRSQLPFSKHCACIAVGSVISCEDILHSRICSFQAHEYSGSGSPFLAVHCTYPFLSYAPFFFFFQRIKLVLFAALAIKRFPLWH